MGAICTRACLAQAPSYAPHNLWLVDHQEPPVPPAPPLERLLQPRVLHVSYAHVINLIKLRQETKEIEAIQMLLFYLIFFLDRSQNYESNRTDFIIFGALNREI
jgi:hypothetical protein